MRALIFDTETTGLWNNRAARGNPNQPDAVQLAAMLVDLTTFKPISWLNVLVSDAKPSEEKALETHGKTPELLEQFGVPRRVAVAIFNNLLKKTDVLIAHNIEFDLNIMAQAYILEGIAPPDFPPRYCTMLSSVDICAIPSPHRSGSFKWPKLIEAYKLLVDPEGFSNAHDALADVRACFEILKVLHQKGLFDVKV
jgi:DNA polymerase III epsilon subunit-like protein